MYYYLSSKGNLQRGGEGHLPIIEATLVNDFFCNKILEDQKNHKCDESFQGKMMMVK